MKRHRFCAFVFALVLGLIGCDRWSSLQEQASIFPLPSKRYSGESRGLQAKILTPYHDVDVWDLPEVVDFNDEQRTYVVALLAAVTRVIEGKTQLEVEEERVFGEGEFFWPKAPSKPIRTRRYYRPDKFRISGISLGFDRANDEASWTKAQLVVRPLNFPKGAYRMALPTSAFADFRLVKARQESRPGERIANPIVFYFSHKSVPGARLKVEAREDLATIDDGFPSSFHAIEMVREQGK